MDKMDGMDKDYDEIILMLDRMEREVTDWEAEFLDSVMKQRKRGRGLSEKQKQVIEKMKRKYRRYMDI